MRLDRKSLARQLSGTLEFVEQNTAGFQETIGQGKAERWTVDQVKFSENARDAARKALWYLRLVEVDSDAVLCEHARIKARDQLRSVIVPDESERCGPDSGPCPYSGAVVKFDELLGEWDAVKAKLSGGELSAAELMAQAKILRGFIADSRPLDWWLRATYVRMPAMGRGIRQHFGLLIALALVLAICIGVEAVRSLLRNDWVITASIFATALAPNVILDRLRRRREKRRRSAFWDIGGRVVHDLPMSQEPERWLTWHPAGYENRVYKGLLYKVIGYLFLWVAGGVLMAGLIRLPFIDEVSLTVYLIVILCGSIALLGGALDFADMHSRAPLRGIVMTGVFLVGAVIIATDNGWWVGATAVLWLLVIQWWAARVRNANVINWIPRTLAALAILGLLGHAVGGMIEARSARRGVEAPLALNEWPRGDSGDGPIVVLAASGGGSRAAIFTARTLTSLETAYPEVAGRLQAISSVSGGSLASAAYISRRVRAAALVDDAMVQPCFEPLVEAVKQDFIAPVILGLPFGGRGRAIEREWTACPVGLGGLDIDMLARLWREAKGSRVPFPVPLFNSVSLERNAVVISPLAQSFLASEFDAEARVDSLNAYRRYNPPTWVHYRSGIYHHRDLLDSANATLSAAVRASANFPFGFPLVEIPTRKRLWYSTSMSEAVADSLRPTQIVRLTDGGALSNSGMWPLVPLLTNQRARIGNDRGVLLIVVDASRMPAAPATDRQRGLFETIMDKNPKGERMHLLMLQQLEAVFGECFGYVHIGIEPTSKFNVYTTWALDRGSVELVENAFAASWREATPHIESEYQRLASCRNSGASRYASGESGGTRKWRGRVPIN